MTNQTSVDTWLPIPGFLDYEISNTGLVRSHKWGRPHLLNPGTYPGGYRFVVLRREGKSYHKQVHRLVLAVFGDGDHPHEQTRHLNGNPADNRLENLTWGSNLDNFEDCVRHGTNGRGSKSAVAKYTEEQILALWYMVSCGYRQTAISAATGIVLGTVNNIIGGRSWRHLNPYCGAV